MVLCVPPHASGSIAHLQCGALIIAFEIWRDEVEKAY